MGLFSRAPQTTHQIITAMRRDMDAKRYSDVVNTRKQLSAPTVSALSESDRFTVEALAVLAAARWGQSTGSGANAMLSALEGWGWLGGKGNPSTPEQFAWEREIDKSLGG